MSAGVLDIYRAFRTGLELHASPEDARFAEAWEIVTYAVHLSSVRLTEDAMGGSLVAAEEVQLHLARFGPVARIARGMPLQVPRPAVRALRTCTRYLADTRDRDEVAEFLRLSAPIADDLGEYAARQMGRHAAPAVAALSLVARSGTLMTDCVERAIPALTPRSG